ncbi:MLP-like protein 31 [Chenopodium quinoa]|uniref:MLP-like protein 31 n=1 Tax=Chenopodium quinoa TaxID=63459 RepID=UPI000B76C75A|nr:MLP-like protein 31 [Chenopodium quinoa]
MSQLQRVEDQTELKCDADKFFEIWAHKPFLVPKMCPNKIQKAELNEGECWDRVGAVITWNYVIDEVGERAIVKTKIEELNDENRCVRYSHLGGKIVEKYYKETLISKIQ